jgi:hypothetical protein
VFWHRQARATIQAVTAAHIQSKISSCVIYGGQSASWEGLFPENFGFPYQFSFHQLLHILYLIVDTI